MMIAGSVVALSWLTARAHVSGPDVAPATPANPDPSAAPSVPALPPTSPALPPPTVRFVDPDGPALAPVADPVAMPSASGPTVVAQPTTPTDYAWRSRAGAAVMLGAGYEDFTSTPARQMTSGGGSWNARALVGTPQFIGLEAAYVGAARGIDTLGGGDNASLVSNGLEGDLRINIPIALAGRSGRSSLIEPFGFVGLGWQHYTLTANVAASSFVVGKDDVMTLPYGGGLEIVSGAFIADARFTYRQTYFNDLMRPVGGNLNTWGVGGNVGVTF